MLKVVSIFLFCMHILYAQVDININTPAVNLENFKTSFYIDPSKNISWDDVLSQDFTDANNKLNLGMKAEVTWIKVTLTNETNSSKKLFLHNTFTYLADNVHFYEIHNRKLIKESIFSSVYNQNTQEMDGAEGVFSFSLKPHQSKTILVRSQCLSYQIVQLKLYDAKHSKQHLISNYIGIVIFVSILLTLAIYNLILYFSSKHQEYLFYALYLISSSIPIAYNYGMLTHYFYVYGDLALKLNAMILISPIFIALFIQEVFLTKKTYPLEHLVLNSIILAFSLCYLYSFLNYTQAIQITSILYSYLLLSLLWVSISIYRKKHPLIHYFLFAHSFYLLSSIIAILFYNGGISFNYFTSHALVFGTIAEAFLFGFLLSHRIKLLEIANCTKDQLIITDGMTQLFNKTHFNAMFEKQLRLQHRNQIKLTLMLIDIDYFKDYNDTYGHLEGDNALISVATSLKKSFHRPDDMVFRVGGEEFAILGSSFSEQKAFSFANNLRKRVHNLKIKHSTSLANEYLTISIGICNINSTQDLDMNTIYKNADIALYQAKEKGRNQVITYDNPTN